MLSTDVARLGPEDSSKIVVTISSTHGVEGYCGSGFLVDWLASVGASGLPKDTAALFVHARSAGLPADAVGLLGGQDGYLTAALRAFLPPDLVRVAGNL